MSKIKKIDINDKNYPVLLKKIKDPPKILYFEGEIKAKESCFAVVGSRNCSLYGKEVTLRITRDLANKGLTIVSGLAPGIDTFSHIAALEENKRTIAVLGTGLDKESFYPKLNWNLSRKIIEKGGMIISEYPIGTHGSKFNFPRRNRIIAGLSLGVLVVEAREKSGALITAEYAFAEKRKVFAVPGQIFSSNSKGTHFLIKKKAKLTESADDILKELKIKDISNISKKMEKEQETNEEKMILSVLKEGAIEIEKIIEKTNLKPQKVLAILSILEIKGRIKNLGDNFYGISSC